MSSTEQARARWQHKSGDRYLPVFGDWFGNERDGFHHEWSALGGLCDTRSAAQKIGFRVQESDDFNIAVVRGRRVVALLWMTEDMAEEPDVLRSIEEVLP